MKQRIKLTESDLHRIVKESVRRALNENNKYYLTPQELIEKYYNNFSEAYKLIAKADKLIRAMNIYEIESIISKIDAGEVDNDMQYCLPGAIDAVHDAKSRLGTVVYEMENYNDSDDKEPEDWYERNEHGDFDEY